MNYGFKSTGKGLGREKAGRWEVGARDRSSHLMWSVVHLPLACRTKTEPTIMKKLTNSFHLADSIWFKNKQIIPLLEESCPPDHYHPIRQMVWEAVIGCCVRELNAMWDDEPLPKVCLMLRHLHFVASKNVKYYVSQWVGGGWILNMLGIE